MPFFAHNVRPLPYVTGCHRHTIVRAAVLLLSAFTILSLVDIHTSHQHHPCTSLRLSLHRIVNMNINF
ncbi:hypothetical protein J6590_017038 [Homalodisca vitripennis]|nr:hypothetical protein J6590_017038 [Homalodisca vitripennis]